MLCTVVVPAYRKIWEAFLDNEVLLNGERVKKKSTSVRRVSACSYTIRVLSLSSSCKYRLSLTGHRITHKTYICTHTHTRTQHKITIPNINLYLFTCII